MGATNKWNPDMSEDPSPYQPPVQLDAVSQAAPTVPPGQIKVMGILHLVLAGLGLVSILLGFVSRKVSESVMTAQEKAGGIQATQARISRGIVEASETLAWFGHVSALVLGTMLLLAGLGLLKRRKSGLSWSNRYAWTSILFKAVNLVLFVTILMPRIGGLFSSLESGGKEMQMFGTMMRISTIAGGIAGPVFSCIYPVLVLILLNRDPVRKSLN